MVVFLLAGAMVKFFEPFKTLLANQIDLGGLSIPTFSNWTAQWFEILTGVALLALLVLGKKLYPTIAYKVFHKRNQNPLLGP